MKVEPLFEQQAAGLGFTHRIRVTHEDLTETTVNTAQTIALLNVKAGTFVDRAAMVLVTPFEDASDANFNSNTILVGDGSVTDRYLRSNTDDTGLQVNVNGTEVLYHVNPVAASTAGLDTAPFMYTADDTIDLVFGSMAAKALSNLDVGILDIYLRVVPLIDHSPLIS